MKAPPTSHTVLLAKPEKAHLTVSLAILNPGLARSAGPNSVHRDSSAVSVIAMKPVAAGGTGSSTSAATTPANSEKNHQACWASPGGGGSMARRTDTPIGMAHRQIDAEMPALPCLPSIAGYNIDRPPCPAAALAQELPP